MGKTIDIEVENEISDLESMENCIISMLAWENTFFLNLFLKIVNEGGEDVKVPHDSVMSELCRIAQEMDTDDENLAMALAVYLLGFSTYNGFSKVAGNVVVDVDENVLKRIYEYAKNL